MEVVAQLRRMAAAAIKRIKPIEAQNEKPACCQAGFFVGIAMPGLRTASQRASAKLLRYSY